MERDTKSIAMMEIIKIMTDVTKSAKYKKDGIVKVDLRLNPALVLNLGQIDRLFLLLVLFTYLERLFKESDYLTFLLN